MTIDNFTGQYGFLSNFYPSTVTLDGVRYKTVEHAYQAAKTLDKDERKKVRDADTAATAKKQGRKLPIRPDWDNVKLAVMEDLLRQKFEEPELAKALCDTGTVELIEGNWWGDQYWGVCRGKGFNHLGRLLMRIRGELLNRKF